MGMNRKLGRFTTLCAAALLAVVGCTSQQQQQTSTTTDKPIVKMPKLPKLMSKGFWPTQSGGGMNWSSMAYPTGNAKTSAIGIEKGMPKEVRLNQPFEYDLVVTNLADHELTDVNVNDKLGDNFTMKGSTPSGKTAGDGTTTWNLGSLAPHESKTIRVTGTATAEGEVCSCASVTYNSLLCACVPVVQPKLQLTKTGPAEVLKCEPIVYTFNVANTGTGAIENVQIEDQLPAGLVTASGHKSLAFNVGTLLPGKSKSYKATLSAERTGTFQNKAKAVGEGGITANSGVVTTVVKAPILTINKECTGTVYVGRAINYTITVKNTGNGVARETVIEDTLPNGVTLVSASDGGQLARGKLVWNVGTLNPGATKTVTARVNPTGIGSYLNSATTQAYCASPVSDNCKTVVKGIPAILLEVIDLEDPVEVGNTTTYVITVTNQGSAPDANIRVTCTLEDNQQYVSSSGATRATAAGRTVTFAPVASLAPKQKATFRVVVKNVKAGSTRFGVSMTSDQLTRPVNETEATNIYK